MSNLTASNTTASSTTASKLTAVQWSETVVGELRVFENQCKDEDLFCVGYIIPQVELVELSFEGDSCEASVWQQRLCEFIAQNMEVDSLVPDDVARINSILAEVFER